MKSAHVVIETRDRLCLELDRQRLLHTLDRIGEIWAGRSGLTPLDHVLFAAERPMTQDFWYAPDAEHPNRVIW